MIGIHVHYTFILWFTCTYAFPTRGTEDTLSKSSKGSWSTEAILGLIAVIVAVLCCAASLAWPEIYWRIRLRDTRNTSPSQPVLLQNTHHSAHTNPPLPFDQVPWQQRSVNAHHHHYYVRVDRAEIRMGH
ncbi:hypothetical protein SVAN01_00209 [Stagonosporopsis vannaccii]|nr:hypothetical protein SVAN01_00209 [Stagonosporopsis vannaccii]